MNWWIISDTHFGHEKIREFCGRPDDCDERMLKSLRDTIRFGDVFIHIGDICIGNDSEWNKRLSNYLPDAAWLIRGNHDRKSNSWYIDQGWSAVADRMDVQMFGKRLVFTHAPIEVPEGHLNIHGHLHNTGHHEEFNDGRHLLVKVEHDYRPYSLKKLVDGFKP